jgi:enoyl-CoA hydratase/carnithine racemase
MNQAFRLNEENKIAYLTFDLPGEKINKFSKGVMEELDNILTLLAERKDLRA